jgi:CRP-like cAMP-binding protein
MWESSGEGQQGRVVRVLELDPDLGVDLDADALESATAELVAPLARVDWTRHRGRWEPAAESSFGVLVVAGMLMREVQLLGTYSAEILGVGDVLRPWDADSEFALPVPAEVHWTVLTQVEVAVLTTAFLHRAAKHPEVLSRLMGRALGRARTLALHDAVTNLKHVETRLLVHFWHMAERWGTMGPDGVSIEMPLTHEMLAKLVGATRPSVTTGLGRLAARGLLMRRPDGVWWLRHDSTHALEPLPIQEETGLPR